MKKIIKKPTVGRPPKYSCPQELSERIDKYFLEACNSIPVLGDDGKVLTTKTGKPLIDYNPPTVAGLALYLGFADRRSLYDYKKKEKFEYVIRRAIARMEENAEKQFTVGQTSGAIFWLKNHGWRDKNETIEIPDKKLSLEELGITKKDIIALAKQCEDNSEST